MTVRIAGPVGRPLVMGAYAVGDVVDFPASTEEALIAAREAVSVAGTTAPSGAGITEGRYPFGRTVIAAGQSTVTVNHPAVDPTTPVDARIAQAAADATATSIVRVVPGDRQFTIYANANATAAVLVRWSIN